MMTNSSSSEPQFSKTEISFIRESNAIERVYDKVSEKDALTAWLYLRSVPVLTIPIVLETHRILMRNQDLAKADIGNFRTCRIFVGQSEGLKWQFIPSAVQDWLEAMNSPMSDEMWKRLHVDYEHIHPFVDGNGRTGRMFMNWHRIKNKLPILVIHEGAEQMDYYKWFKEDKNARQIDI
jgi:Fic family protein